MYELSNVPPAGEIRDPHEWCGDGLLSGMSRREVWWILTGISEDLAAFMIRVMIKALRASQTSISVHQITWCNIPQDRLAICVLRSRRM